MKSEQKFPLQEVVNDLTDIEKSPTAALIKLNLLGLLTKNEELIKFTKSEMEGYGSNYDSVPQYRKVNPVYIVEVQDEYGRPETIEIPAFALAEPYNKLMKEIPIKEGVGTIQMMKNDLLSNANSSSVAKLSVSMIMLPHFQDAVNKLIRSNFATNVTKVWAQYSVYKLQDILDTVRSRLLSFVVDVANNFGYNIEIETYKKNQTINNQTINNIMNTNITNTGDGNVVNTGDNSTLKVNTTITKGDTEKLIRVMKDLGVDGADLEELKEIVVSEHPDHENKTLGQRAIGWITKITGKALSGAGKIAVKVTSSVLSEYIKQYYGLI